MLTAEGSIIITKPLQDVWNYITKPEGKHTWWFNDGRWIESSWIAGSPIHILFDDGTEGSRGSIVQREEGVSILFNLHDAYEEDQGYEDYTVEDWRITVLPDENGTKVVMAISDYDGEHFTDDAHDHEEAIKMYKDAQDDYIPGALKQLKQELEKNN